VRIISGKNKGRKINPPNDLPVRPTTDMAKESLFNILNNLIDFDQIDVLDLFSGTGNIAYEFASRGAGSVTAVDISHKCVRFIKQISEQLNFDQITIVQADYRKFLNRNYRKWDVIFTDPPYALENITDIHQMVFDNQLLKENGLLIIEHDQTVIFENHKGFLDHRNYGKVNFSFFRQVK